MCCNLEKNQMFQELSDFIASLETKEGALIEVLHRAQGIFGYLPKEVQNFVAEKLDLPIAKVYGVVTFYSFFTTEPRGKNVINICMGTACFVRGSGDVLKEFEKQLGIKNGETSSDMKYTLGSLRCVGACGLAPVITINDKVYGHCTTEDVKTILKEYE